MIDRRRKHRKKHLLGAVLLSLVIALQACHFPQPIPENQSHPGVSKTEIAGILNPEGLPEPDTALTSTSVALPLPTPTAGMIYLDGYIQYTTQQGDTLPALAERFGVSMGEIQSDHQFPVNSLLPIGVTLQIPDVLDAVLPYHAPVLPDSEIVYGPSVGDFDTFAYIYAAGGYLTIHNEVVKGEVLSGPEVVQRVAIETSTNPRLLLAFLEYRSGWVLDHPPDAVNNRHPIGYGSPVDFGLYNELMITARLLAQGFYGWRDGSRLIIGFFGGGSGRLSPGLNAGSTALMNLFAALYRQEVWDVHLYGHPSFLTFYQELFGDYWARAAGVEPYLLSTTLQPVLSLPFSPGEAWSLTGGPHNAWQTGSPRGAVDFAPITGEPHCAVSTRWVTASAAGLVVRAAGGVVALDLDGDGDEGTGWVLIFHHIAEQNRTPLGTWLEQDAPIGHPSCEGGRSTGTHVHLARKFNGEWVGVDESLPFILSGWRVFAGPRRYEGYLQKGEQIVTSRPDGSFGSTIIRD